MPHYRIEYLSQGLNPGERMSMPVPDLRTALIVADINRPTGDVELWDGQQQIARLHREDGGRSGYWQIG
ncbi:hypothetical protein M3P36_07680 [Altererythrobacter sp. KTW20L]|uniref:hypothetical protein n=1 Tax=Altererythrobacter sp. KTW20L TaxID=2942210 RepID=UPI0020BF70A2|nr:hypothetical protein [Altererythrobacter sp. KTW20L]MCL6250919.1 hypothetical protein [Altererythrobacter sp. KTW20L]